VREAFQEVFGQIDAWFGRPAEVREYKPLDSGWSIDEILEHITLTTHFLMIVVRNNYPKAIKRALKQPIENGESDLEKLIPIGQRGSFGWIRPEHMEPKGDKPISEIQTLMRSQKTECLQILEKLKNGEGSLFRVRMSVNDTGHIDLYQWLYFIAQHAKRHLSQMEENVREQQTLKPI
jgi:hypothetical protein